jgi:hypothetical protein
MTMDRLPDLFPASKPPRAVPRKLMHVSDASPDGCFGDGLATVRMMCARCRYESDWLALSVTNAKRGTPCPNCNKE